MFGLQTPILLTVYCVLLGSIDKCQGKDELCGKNQISVFLGLEQCGPDNCHGTCTTGTNELGYALAVCCADPNIYTCYNQSNLLGMRLACFNASSEGDTDCEKFDVNVQCVAELYNQTFEECRPQYLDLYQRFFITNNDFNPKNCPCETGYTKVNQPCPCTDNTDKCGINMGHTDICCFKTSFLVQEVPCLSNERYIALDYGTCSKKTCKGRCEGGVTGEQICCISPDDIRVVGDSHQSEEGSSAGGIVGGIIAVLVAVAVTVGIVVYMRKTGRLANLRLRCKNRRKKTDYNDIQMQTQRGNEMSHDNATYSDVL